MPDQAEQTEQPVGYYNQMATLSLVLGICTSIYSLIGILILVFLGEASVYLPIYFLGGELLSITSLVSGTLFIVKDKEKMNRGMGCAGSILGLMGVVFHLYVFASTLLHP